MVDLCRSRMISDVPGGMRALWLNISDNEDKAAEVLAGADEQCIPELVKFMELEELVKLLQLMEVDDETDVISCLDEKTQAKVLSAIQEQERTQVEDLLAFPEDSAGGLMHLHALRLTENNTCRDAITHLQESENVEMVFYLYVQNEVVRSTNVNCGR